jgi:hypothetical protein
MDWGSLARIVMVSIGSLSHPNLIIGEGSKWTYELDWRSESSICSDKVPFVKIKVKRHVFLVVSVE